MIRIENTVLPSPEQWQSIIMSIRNPMNSWKKSDSRICPGMNCDHCNFWTLDMSRCSQNYCEGDFVIGPNDLNLMKRLCKSGTDHRKFMRMITVYADIIAPLYWWPEYDTYKIGTVTNSCSKMHKIADKEFTMEDFSKEHLLNEPLYFYDGMDVDEKRFYPVILLYNIVESLNLCRKLYIQTKDKTYWWRMIQLLPSSYNQKRTVMLNYEVLANIYKSRKDHKLDEWREFCKWIETLPYSELITGDIS